MLRCFTPSHRLKNVSIALLRSKSEVLEWVRDHLLTNEAKKNFDQKGLYYKVALGFARIPHFVFDRSDEVEQAHFSTWWGGILNRSYGNPYIHDLYLLHEMSHIAYMSFVKGLAFENWRKKMTDNELIASVISEIVIYLEIPGLHEKTFKQPIFADRFITRHWRNRWNQDPEGTIREISLIRRDAMEREPAKKDGVPIDIPAFWVNRFAAQNDAWHAVWSFRYDEVESLLADVESVIRTSPNKNYKESGAMKYLMDGIAAGSKPGTKTSVPWYEEAVAFDAVYRMNRKMYEASIIKEITP